MADMASCPVCDFPIPVYFEGEIAKCANCGQKMEVIKASPRLSGISGISGISGFWPFMLGLGLGVFFGPAIISASKGGRAYLERTAREAEAKLKEK